MSQSSRTCAVGIIQRLQKAGHTAFWVGGCVRDLLLEREPEDYDIVTSALPEQVESLFKRTLAVGRRFGVMIVIERGCQFQVATFRADAEYQDGRRPERVRFGDAIADARRRDFTVNGLYFDPARKELHDWVHGQEDLRAGIIRTIGNPAERFAEDHLRLLRAVRFAARLGFDIEPATFEAIKGAAPKIQLISAERIRDELIKLFAPPKPDTPPKRLTPAPAAHGLDLLRDTGLLEQVLPELASTIGCKQSRDYHPEGTVYEHVRLMLDKLPAESDPLLPWTVLMHDIGKPSTFSHDASTGKIHFYEHEKVGAEMARDILERLRFPRKQVDAVTKTVLFHMQFKDAPQMRRSTLRRMLMRPTFNLELELHRLDCLGSHGRLDIYDFLNSEARQLQAQPRLVPPLLNGTDLIALGYRPGPALGKLLAEIREKQLQGELTTPADARDWVGRRRQ